MHKLIQADRCRQVPGVHVLTAPRDNPLELYDFEVLSLVLSVKNWRRLCGPMCLCIDVKSRDFLAKLGVLGLYDRIMLFRDDEFDGIDRGYFWAAGKIIAARKLNTPFVILDLDCCVHERPRFDFDAAVQPLNFERPYPCYERCDVKYGAILPEFSGEDWQSPPVNVGMLGYYSPSITNEYTEVAIEAMRKITALDPDHEAINKYRDHIIFIEQKLLPMFVAKRGGRLAVFEDGYFDVYLSTARTTHLWGMKGEYHRHGDLKLEYMSSTIERYPEAAEGISNPQTASTLARPVSSTRVFLERGVWGKRGTRRWDYTISGPLVRGLPPLHASPMPCGVTQERAVIHFETVEPADATIEYGPSPEDIAKHRTRLYRRQTLFEIDVPETGAGFGAGDRIYYRLRARPAGEGVLGTGPAHAFRLARPYGDAGPWCCSVGADCRGQEPDTLDDRFQNYHWPAAGRQGEEFHLAPGDLIHATRSPGKGVDFWRTFRGPVDGVGREGEKCADLPVFISIGNHEEDTVPGTPSHAEARISRLPLGAFLELPGQQTKHGDPKWKQRYYYFTWGQVLFVGLDSETAYTPGRIGLTQRWWVEQVLKAHESHKWKVLFAHRPVDASTPVHHRNIADHPVDREWLLRMIETYGVQIFAHGHYHGWRVKKRAGKRDWHICAAWGSKEHPTSGSWRGQSFYARFRFGERWRPRGYEAHPDWMTVEVVNPFKNTAAGGTVFRRFTIHA